MNVADEFRKNAERCRVEAERATETADRAFWLLLAENWQKLAQDSSEAQYKADLGQATLPLFNKFDQSHAA
jgi:hypothetical protein